MTAGAGSVLTFFTPTPSKKGPSRTGRRTDPDAPLSLTGSSLNKRPRPLHCRHEDTERDPGDDAAQCDVVSPGFIAALYLRATLPPDARRRTPFRPHVFGRHAAT